MKHLEVGSDDNPADVFTKRLDVRNITKFESVLGQTRVA